MLTAVDALPPPSLCVFVREVCNGGAPPLAPSGQLPFSSASLPRTNKQTMAKEPLEDGDR